MLVLYSSEFINGNYIGKTLNPWKAHLSRIGSGVGDINDALKWFLYPGCYSFLLNRILAPEDLALKTLHAYQTLSLMTFNVSVLQASQERPVLLVSMLVRSSNEVDEDRFIHLGGSFCCCWWVWRRDSMAGQMADKANPSRRISAN